MKTVSSYGVLLINLTSEETLEIRGLLSQFDPDIQCFESPTIAEAEGLLSQTNLVLVILRVDETRKRPDQDVHRIRRLLPRPAPVLLLITPEHAGKVKEYLRAGADEYWILPLDSSAFPPRLQVLVEWGMSALESSDTPERSGTRKGGVSLLMRLSDGLRSIFAFSSHGRSRSFESSDQLLAGKWLRVRRLGFGSFGEVSLVRAQESETFAVAKIPHSTKMNTKFLREAAILRRLSGHPNAVQLIEVVKEDGKVILIQEYVEGATLQDLLGQGIESAIKETAFLQLLDVLACAHEQKIMHRDVKPENIIITRSGILKLLDFGTGKDLTRRSISNTVIGSRPFMAPEQIMGSSRLASDVWAAGVILYALATTCLPFYDDNEKQLMDIILESAPERPRNLEPELPEELEAIILRCLEKDWTKRYRDAGALRSDLLANLPEFGQGKTLPSA